MVMVGDYDRVPDVDRSVHVTPGQRLLIHGASGGVDRYLATCKRCGVEPFAWFRDVLTRIATHSLNRLAELLPHNWKALVASQS